MSKEAKVVIWVLISAGVILSILEGHNKAQLSLSTIASVETLVRLENPTYLKDNRTNLCFASISTRRGVARNTAGFGFASVPCTPEVEALITEER